MLLLGIETSCDDTAVAILRDGRDAIANVSTNQDEFHRAYGGIVPEIASRAHLALLSAAIEHTLDRARMTLADCDGIAVTYGPGLIGSLLVGVATAKALAFAARRPLYAINHLHGHLFAPFLESAVAPPYPFLALLVSGGHTQLVAVDGPMQLRVLGKTRDDAAGEAFDKTARLLGLGFPGGPALDALARDGDARAIAFPRYRPEGDALDFSFSGLKTSVRYFLERPENARVRREDVAASFQAAVVDALVARVDAAFSRGSFRAVALSGGVAANSYLQQRMRAWAERCGVDLFIPPRSYCTDNAAMIAAAAEAQGEAVRVDPLVLAADPNLPFERIGNAA